MHMTVNKLADSERALLKCFRSLSETDQSTLMAFAEFLTNRGTTGGVAESIESPSAEIPKPELEPRPVDETVVAAIKRLTSSYPMVERSSVFSEASDLMTQHLMQGREAKLVIDDLEALYLARYQALLNK